MIRVLVADDYPIVRTAIKNIVARSGDIEVVAEAGNGKEVLELVGQHAFDLVLLDVEMPEMDGITVLNRLRISHPLLPVLFVSHHPVDQMVENLLKIGARGYVVKERVSEDLLEAIRMVIAGLIFVRGSQNYPS